MGISSNCPAQQDSIERGYRALCCAIVRQALKDHAPRSWFLSDWYNFLMPDIDGAKLYDKAQENYRKYGRYYEKEEW